MQDIAETELPTQEVPRPGLPYSLKMLWRDRRRSCRRCWPSALALF